MFVLVTDKWFTGQERTETKQWQQKTQRSKINQSKLCWLWGCSWIRYWAAEAQL